MGSSSVADVLLRRRGLVFVDAPPTGAVATPAIAGVELELAELGYVLSTRLRARLARLPIAELGRVHLRAWEVLSAAAGAHVAHRPLFRRFPEDVPADTTALWWKKVLVSFLQAPDQPCLFCRQVGTTHVLRPCAHVVCDRCFDGSAYTACPVCEHHVDRSSPFFSAPDVDAPLPTERPRWKLLDLGEDLDADARALLLTLCERTQVPSPGDRDDLVALLEGLGERALGWLPARIPVKETVATVFGTLFRTCAPDAVLPVARAHLSTATDVLRFVAALSGADPSLQGETVWKPAREDERPRRWWGKALDLVLGAATPHNVPVKVRRFKVAKLSRPLRRSLLALLEGLDPERRIEDMLRHRSYWVWLGEFLHPHEHAARFPGVARAFAVVRKKAPDGTPAPRFEGFYARVDAAVRAQDLARLLAVLRARPGELARRFDHAMRLAGEDERAQDEVLEAFTGCVEAFSTPVLLTLRGLLPTRRERAPVRIFWPKGAVAKGVSAPDARRTLPARVIAPAVRAVEGELLRRFAQGGAVDTCVVDEALKDVVAPFNERTASRAAVALPRGSRVPVPPGKTVRLFLHWCEPEVGGRATDVDLSVALYDASWGHVGVCSFYSLKLTDAAGATIATSSGDLRSAPFPDGASEFVDVHRERALAAGARYAVMVVNAFAGMSFSQLERAFAGVMLRDDVHGATFDPRTVELRFDVQGDNGIYLPLVLDLEEGTLHWLDVQSKGELQLNTAASSSAAVTKLCPELMTYFASGVRTSMFDLALLHAAARARRVVVRGRGTSRVFDRAEGEDAPALLARLRSGEGGETSARDAGVRGAVLAALFEGDLDLPAGSACYALFRGRVTPTLAASDLI